MLTLFSPVQSDSFISLATEIESDMGPWPKIGKWGENLFFLCIIDFKLEIFMEQYSREMQKRNNEAKQRRDVQIDEERRRRKRGTKGGREGGVRKERIDN